MNIEYKREFEHFYMIITSEEVIENSYKERMLTDNLIPGLVPCHIQSIDGYSVFYYDISSHTSLRLLMEEGRLDTQMIRIVFEHILNLLCELPEYLLSADHILLTTESIFCHHSERTIKFIFYPQSSGDFRVAMRDFLEEIMPTVNHTDSEEYGFIYELYAELLKNNLSTNKMREILFGSEQKKTENETTEEEDPAEFQREESMEISMIEVQNEENRKDDNISLYILFGSYMLLSVLLILIAVAMYYNLVPRLSVPEILGGFIVMLSAVSIGYVVYHQIKKKDFRN